MDRWQGKGMNELVGWVRYLSQCRWEFVPERHDMERLKNLSDEVTEGQCVLVDEVQVKRGGWMVNN